MAFPQRIDNRPKLQPKSGLEKFSSLVPAFSQFKYIHISSPWRHNRGHAIISYDARVSIGEKRKMIEALLE